MEVLKIHNSKKKVTDKVNLYFNLRVKLSFYLCVGGGGRTYGCVERNISNFKIDKDCRIYFSHSFCIKNKKSVKSY